MCAEKFTSVAEYKPHL